MKFQISSFCVLVVLSSSNLCNGGDVALATLKASVKFPDDSSDDQQSKSGSGSDLYATASQQHATSVASFKFFNGAGGGAGAAGSHHPYQQKHDESGSQSGKGFYQGYSSNADHQPLTATTYGPPKPMPYRNSHPSSLAAPRRPAPAPAPAPGYRHRGVVLPAKLTLPYGQPQPSVDLTHKYARPATDFRKYYKKAPEVSAVRKPASPYKYVQSSITDSGSKFTPSPYKDDYTKSYKTKQSSSSPYKSHTSDTSNENYSAFGSQDINDSLPDPFSKEFYDVYYKAKENRYQQQHQTTKPTTSPPRINLSKYYKKPVNHFPAKPVAPASNSPYKSTPGKVFSDSLDYTRPDYFKSPGSPSFSSSSYGGAAASALAPISTKLGSSEWTPINAPAGAVPARSYEISPPDLSRSHPQPQHPQHTYQPRHDFEQSTNTINYRTGASSEGIVSANVMVNQ
ncbi:hypothetical protein LSTR_LSTR000177 [Laodelphax striatellus]|uniref:Uncharacterized protein n=1 Tax=Laodelphax striatellus TaxID=195883 RepID=A0A482X6X4_LAOST|nr:hypothetical protein LSTR_LSTR000177 [Laodelphax striatellus]